MSEELQLLKDLHEKFDHHLSPLVERMDRMEAKLGDHDDFISAQRTLGRAVVKGGAAVAGIAAFSKMVYDWLHK